MRSKPEHPRIPPRCDNPGSDGRFRVVTNGRTFRVQKRAFLFGWRWASDLDWPTHSEAWDYVQAQYEKESDGWVKA